jgi:hypothetical protein
MDNAAAAPAGPHPSVGLSYIDVLFGLATGRAFLMALGDVSQVRSEEWSHFVVVLVLIACSWIGYHWNRTRSHPSPVEFTLAALPPLAQFGIDVALVALYYRMASRIRADHTIHTELRLMITVFVLYAMWDILDLKVSRDRQATAVRVFVDIVWVGLLSEVAHASWAARWAQERVVLVDVVLVALLVVYRYVPRGVLELLPGRHSR